MIVLINGGPALDRFGVAPLGRLVSPRSGNRVKPGERWAGDNDAFKAWDETRFLRMLRRFESVPGCLFVAVPDVPFDARATLGRFDDWRWEVAGRGLPVALVGQNGMEGLSLPWDQADALFLGGDDRWKVSAAAGDLCDEARRRGLWVHMGRVNSFRRMNRARLMLCDSIDGTGWSMFPDFYLRTYLPGLRRLNEQGVLDFALGAGGGH